MRLISTKKKNEVEIFSASLSQGSNNFGPFMLLKKTTVNIFEEEEDFFQLTTIENDFIIAMKSENEKPEIDLEILTYSFDGNLISTKMVPLPSIKKRFNLYRIIPRQNKGFFVCLKTFSEKNSTENFPYILLSIDVDKINCDIIEMEIPGLRFSSIHFHYDNQQLFIAGLLKEKKRNAPVTAFYSVGFDEKLNTISPLEFMDINRLIEKNIFLKDKNKEWLDLKSLDLLKANDGYYLVAEQQRRDNICLSDFRTGFIRCNDYYYYTDLLCIYIGINNTPWKATFKKYQSSIDDGGYYSSIVYATDGQNNLYLIYNDHRKNQGNNSSSIKSMNNPSKSICKYQKLNQNGIAQTNFLYSSKEQNIILVPRFFIPNNNYELFVFGEKGGINKIGKLGLP